MYNSTYDERDEQGYVMTASCYTNNKIIRKEKEK